MSMSAYSMYLAEHETEKCPCPRLIILWEDRVGEGGGSVAEGGGWRVGGALALGGGGGGGGGGTRNRFGVDLYCILKRFKIIFGYFWL